MCAIEDGDDPGLCSLAKALCEACGKPVDGPMRNHGGEMGYSCSLECAIKLESRNIRKGRVARKAFLQEKGWVALKDGGFGRWYKKKWLVTYRKGGEQRWELHLHGGRRGEWRASGRCRSRAHAWRIACALARLLEKR